MFSHIKDRPINVKVQVKA